MIQIPIWVLVLVAVLVVALVCGIWAAGIASRLNRLHIRTDSARISLEGALAARAGVIAALQPDLAVAAAQAGRVALTAVDMGARSDLENRLLAQVHPDVLGHAACIETSTRVDLAARFYNDAVADTRAVRMRPLVRVLHLAGSAPLPHYYEAISTADPTGAAR